MEPQLIILGQMCHPRFHKALRLMISKVREKPIIMEKNLQDDLKATGTTITQGTISRHMHCKLHSYTPCKTPLLRQYRHACHAVIQINQNSFGTKEGTKQGCTYELKKTTPAVNYKDGGIVIWGYFSANHSRVIQGWLELCEPFMS